MNTLYNPTNSIDKYVFRYCVEQLKDKGIEEICEFYVTKFIFKNADNLKTITERYKLPNDMLKMHKRITKLAQELQ